MLYDNLIPSTPGDIQQANIPGSAGPFRSQHAAGAQWDIQAIGPEGKKGLWGVEEDYYLVHPYKPMALNSYAEYEEGQPVTICWSTGFSPMGLFEYKVYYGDDCSNLQFSGTVSGWARYVPLVRI